MPWAEILFIIQSKQSKLLIKEVEPYKYVRQLLSTKKLLGPLSISFLTYNTHYSYQESDLVANIPNIPLLTSATGISYEVGFILGTEWKPCLKIL